MISGSEDDTMEPAAITGLGASDTMSKEKIINRNFMCTFTAQFALALVMYTLMTTIAEYVTAFGATATVAGLVTGAYVVGGLVSRLYSGNAVKKYGWKRVALVFGTVHFIASCLYGFAGNEIILLIIRFVHGVGFGATSNAVMITGMSGLPKSRYGEAAGYFMMSTSLGVAFGPFLGGLIYDEFGGKGCFTAAIVFSLITVIAMSIVDTRELDPWYHRNEKTAFYPLPDKKNFRLTSIVEYKAIPISLCIFCLCFGYAALMSFHRLFAQYTGLTGDFKYFFLIYAAVLIVSRPVAGRLQDKMGDNIVCYPCIIAQAVGIALMTWNPCTITIVICAVCGALGFGTLNSTFNAIINRQVSDERRPYAISTYWAFCDLGVGTAPTILGGIITISDFYIMYYAAAAISLAALPIYRSFWGRVNRSIRGKTEINEP